MALVSDPSLDGFNSFVSVDEASDYFAGSYFGSGKSWDDVSDYQEALLITATRKLNSLLWAGSPVSDAQVLAFPRSFSSGEYGYSYFPNVAPMPINGWIPVGTEIDEVDPATFIPMWLKRATYEMAHWLWSEEDRPVTDIELSYLKSQKVGPLDQVFKDGVKPFPPEVLAILGSLGSAVIDLGQFSGFKARGGRLVY